VAQASALLRFERISFRKVKPVADLIRNKKVPVAEQLLTVSPRRAARVLLKLLKSASANAENNPDLGDAESLYVSRVDVGPGPSMKRVKFKARGRIVLIRHRTSQVRIVLEQAAEEDETERKSPPVTGREKLEMSQTKEETVGSED